MKLKRLVSAVLAVGMALTMLPTAAFAAGTTTSKHITGIVLTADGKIDAASSGGQKGSDGTYSTNLWSVSPKGNFSVYSGSIFDEDSFANNTQSRVLTCDKVFNGGTIKNGTFEGIVVNYGVIEDGTFKNVQNCNKKGAGQDAGIVKGGVIENYSVVEDSSGVYETSFANAIVWGTMNQRNKTGLHKIISGIMPSKPENTTSSYYGIEADGCTLTGTFNGQELSFKDAIYVVGDSNATARTIVVTPASTERKIVGWKVEGIDTYTQNGMDSVTLEIPANYTKNITVTIEAEKYPLVASDDNPVYGLNKTDGTYGSAYDGWKFYETDKGEEIVKNLTVYPDFTADLGSEAVDWVVANNGTIAGGTYVKEVVNYGRVTGGTYPYTFRNRAVNGVEGTVESGVFGRTADFSEQNPDITWLTVKNGNINHVAYFSMAGIVGKQTVTVKADTGFKCWSVSGDTDFALTEEQKYNPELTLTLNGEDKGNIILTAQTEEGYYRLNLTDGKAYSATADGAKDQEINAAKPGDTVILEADASLIPDGMVFDRWEVTGDTELTGSFDAKAEKTSFTMPKSEVTLRAMYRMADQPEEPNVLGTVAMVATAGMGAAVVGYTGYMIGTELYLNTVLPEGTAIPNNATELAVLVWTDAGKPAPAAVLAADATDEQKALTWAVENQLISADKAADASVARWEVIDAWNKAQEMKH